MTNCFDLDNDSHGLAGGTLIEYIDVDSEEEVDVNSEEEIDVDL